MPKNAEVFIVEDDHGLSDTIVLVLEGGGHRIGGRAFTRDEAIKAAANLPKGVTVATVDGNLDDLKDISGDDGRAVVQEFRTRAPTVKIIGLSGTGTVEGADVNLKKSPEVLLYQLATTVDQL
ncbi:hypothetical protein HY410_00940 [Candidatus Gottesmanbacteria bacterium]|nr:hypothetical protein [Candidatus Gottesmanbacteria bacterium]